VPVMKHLPAEKSIFGSVYGDHGIETLWISGQKNRKRGVYCLLLRLKIEQQKKKKEDRSFIHGDLMHIISIPHLAIELSKPSVCISRAPETTRRISEKQSRWIAVVDFAFV